MPLSQMGQKSPMACPETGSALSARAQRPGHCRRLLLAAASSGGGKPDAADPRVSGCLLLPATAGAGGGKPDAAGLRVPGCLFAANGVGCGKPDAAAPRPTGCLLLPATAGDGLPFPSCCAEEGMPAVTALLAVLPSPTAPLGHAPAEP